MDPHRASQHHFWDKGGLLDVSRVGAFVHYSKVAMVCSFNILTMGISTEDGFKGLVGLLMVNNGNI